VHGLSVQTNSPQQPADKRENFPNPLILAIHMLSNFLPVSYLDLARSVPLVYTE